jgi:hypothetical protein
MLELCTCSLPHALKSNIQLLRSPRLRESLSHGLRQIVVSGFHLSQHEHYRWLNGSLSVGKVK